MLSYVINTMSEIYQEYRKYSKEYRVKINEMNRSLEARNVDQHLRLRALKYMECYYKTGIDSSVKLDSTLNNLSKYLKEEILKDTNLKVLKNVSFLTKYFSSAFLEKLCLKMSE